MLKKFLLLTAATVSMYASSVEELDTNTRSSSIDVTVCNNQEVRLMEDFKTAINYSVNNLMLALSKEKELLMSQQIKLSGELNTAKADLGKKTEELADLQRNFDAAVIAHEEQLVTANKSVSSNSEAMQTLQEQLTAATTNNEKLAKENAELTEASSAMTSAVSKLTSDLADFDQRVLKITTDHDENLVGMKQNLKSAQKAVEEKESDLINLRNELDSLLAIKAEHEQLASEVAPYNHFMQLHKSGTLTRTASGIFEDAKKLPGVESDLENTKHLLDRQNAELQSAKQTISELLSQADGNSTVQKELKELKEEAASYQKGLADMQQGYEKIQRDSLIVLEETKDKMSSLSEQLQIEQAARKAAEDQLTKISEAMKRMETAAAGNTELVTQLQMQATELKKAKEEAEMQEKAAAQKLASADAQRQRLREVKISERAANASKSLRSIVSAQAESNERSKAVFENTISNIQIKNMVDVALQAGIDVSNADKDLLLLKNNKTYTKNAAGDAERALDDKQLIESKQAAAKQLLLALRAKATELKLDNPDGLDTALLIGAIQSKIKKQ